MRRLGPIALLMMLTVCIAPANAQQKANDALAKLQAAQAASPGSVAANRALGVWYYRAGRFAEARVPLDQARKLDANDGVSALYAGLAAEQMKDFTAAKSAYNAYLTVGKTKSAQKEIRARLVAISQAELKEAAKTAVANESAISATPGATNTIAVLPFTIGLADPSYAPLGRGLADLMITDLSKSRQLTIVERERMQAIVDEIALSKSANVDAATTVRAGKLIQAGRIVQGQVLQGAGGTGITISSNVVASNGGGVTAVTAPNGTLDKLFDLEKTLVMNTFRTLGITLTPAEAQEVDRRSTSSLAAFLAYSRGLQAQDDGRFDEAARFFDNARSIDPGFGAALARSQQASAASQSSTAKVETSIRSSSEGAAASVGTTTAGAGLASTLNTVVGGVNPTTTNTVSNTTGGSSPAPPSTRDAASEKSGTDQPAPRTGTVTVIIHRP